jgi:uncharacterized protein (DUF885 family)
MGQLYSTEKKAITDADKVRLGAELAAADRALIETKEEKTDVSRNYRVRIRNLEEQVASLARQLDTGVVENKFPIEEVPDDARGMINVLRADTKELVDSRQMNEAERAEMRKRKQGELFEEGEEDEDDDEAPKPRNGGGGGAAGTGKVSSLRPRGRRKKSS